MSNVRRNQKKRQKDLHIKKLNPEEEMSKKLKI